MMDDEAEKLQELRHSMDFLKLGFEQVVEGIVMSAKACKIAYDQLLEEGFTAEQAIDLIKARGPYLNPL